MDNVCHTGFKELVQLYEEHQCLFEEALDKSALIEHESGKVGEPLPYLLQSDTSLTLILFVGFMFFVHAFRYSRKYLQQRVHYFFMNRERSSLFDQRGRFDFKYIFLLGTITCMLAGFCLYDYFLGTCPLLFATVPHLLLITIYIGVCLLLAIIKRMGYGFVNWIFFNRDQNKRWMDTYFDVLAGCSFLLFPIVLLIFYADLSLPIAKLLVFIVLIFAKILLFYRCARNFFPRFHGVFHLILYFCTFEIVPDLFVWKGIEEINNILVFKF